MKPEGDGRGRSVVFGALVVVVVVEPEPELEPLVEVVELVLPLLFD